MIKRRKKPLRNLFKGIFCNFCLFECPGSVVAYLENQGLIIRPCRMFEYRKAGTRVRLPARAYGSVAQLGRALDDFNNLQLKRGEAFNQGVVGSKWLFFQKENFEKERLKGFESPIRSIN